MPVAAAAASGVKSRASGSSASKPSLSSASRPGSRQPLGEDHVHEREQQVRVGAGADEVVLVGDLGGARAPRVDDHDLAAALLDRAQAPAHVGRGQQAAVGGERVGAEDQQVVGAVDVRHRDRQRAAEHQRRGDLLRPLVDRARRVDVAGAERLGEHAAVEQRRPCRARRGCRCRARRRRDRAPRAAAAGGWSISANASSHVAGANEPSGCSQHRRAQAVRVLVQRLDRDALGAQEAVREDVVGVAADLDELVALEGQLEPAGRLAERAGAEGGARHRASLPALPRPAGAGTLPIAAVRQHVAAPQRDPVRARSVRHAHASLTPGGLATLQRRLGNRGMER